jgi:hypothetical protein
MRLLKGGSKLELTTQYGDYTIKFNSRDKIYAAQNADGDVIRDGFSDIEKLTESLDNLDKRAEKGKKKAVVKVAALMASDSGYCKSITATSIAPTGWRGEPEVWTVDGGKRSKERSSSVLLDTPENRATLKKLQDAFNVEKASEKDREKTFAALAHITSECFEG